MTELKRGFLTAEDEALKAKLSNLSVTIRGGKKRPKVWFGMPEREREKEYPFVTIDLIDVVFAADRAHSAQMRAIDYWPSEYPTFAEWAAANDVPFDPETFVEAVEWHPYDLYYQVATHARYNQHDRELMQQLLRTKLLPDRWGYLDVPQDGSVRWLDRLGFSNADYMEGAGQEEKRVFRKIYNISVSAQLPPEDPLIYYQVLATAITLSATGDPGTTESWTTTFTP